MTGWRAHTGQARVLSADNIDTDQLIPARFMSVPRADGYGDYLMYDQRHTEDGAPVDHPLNDTRPSILIAGRNFGSGSSREAAVYALVDYGIRAVLAPSFGDIFAGNAVNNGLLPAQISSADHATLTGWDRHDLKVDLDAATVVAGAKTFAFKLDPVWQTKLINGWDDIDLTQNHADTLRTFAQTRRSSHPWTWPATSQ